MTHAEGQLSVKISSKKNSKRNFSKFQMRVRLRQTKVVKRAHNKTIVAGWLKCYGKDNNDRYGVPKRDQCMAVIKTFKEKFFFYSASIRLRMFPP